MTKEEFAQLWQEQGICPCNDCTEQAYRFIKGLIARARERIAGHLESKGNAHLSHAAAIVRMLGVEGVVKDLDIWPRPGERGK